MPPNAEQSSEQCIKTPSGDSPAAAATEAPAEAEAAAAAMPPPRSTRADFVPTSHLGAGGYGGVWRAKSRRDGRDYAVKEVDLTRCSKAEQRAAVREAALLSAFDDPHIVRYYDAFLEKGRLYIVMEYAPGGSLADLIRDAAAAGVATGEGAGAGAAAAADAGAADAAASRGGSGGGGGGGGRPALLPEARVWKLLIEMTLGLHAMHAAKVLHRDLKPANVVLAAGGGRAQLADLGVAKAFGDARGGGRGSSGSSSGGGGGGYSSSGGGAADGSGSGRGDFAATAVGTPAYMSPEALAGRPYGEKSDVWSLGVCAYELCALRHPFDLSAAAASAACDTASLGGGDGNGTGAAVIAGTLPARITAGAFPPLRTATAAGADAPGDGRESGGACCTAELASVVHACLALDPCDRPSTGELLASPALRARAGALGIALPPLSALPPPPQLPPLPPSQGADAGGGGSGATALQPTAGAAAVPEQETTLAGAMAAPRGSPSPLPLAVPQPGRNAQPQKSFKGRGGGAVAAAAPATAAHGADPGAGLAVIGAGAALVPRPQVPRGPSARQLAAAAVPGV